MDGNEYVVKEPVKQELWVCELYIRKENELYIRTENHVQFTVLPIPIIPTVEQICSPLLKSPVDITCCLARVPGSERTPVT